MENNEKEEDDDNYPPEYGDIFMGEAEEEAHDKPANDLGRTIADARRDCGSEKERGEVGSHVRGSQKVVVPKL